MQVADVEDIAPLSPLQQEVLSQVLQHPGDDVHVVQLCVALSGALSPPALEAAWERTAARHSALRTSFRPWKVPAQLVRRREKPPFAVQERREDAEIAAFLEEDRARGFDPAKGPLVRLSILRTAPDEHLLVWTYHRLVLDGWSAALLVDEVLTGARTGTEPEDAPPPRKYRDYVDRLRGLYPAEAERFWRRELAGLSAPPSMDTPGSRSGRTGRDVQTARLTASATAALQALMAEEKLSLETLVQGAWALLLSRRTGRTDVLFGITAAGRPPSFPGAESILGRFANTLPLRVTVEPETPLLSWLRELEEHRAALRPHEHVPLSLIREWTGISPDASLFDSRLAVESLPASPEIRAVRWIEASTEPLAVSVRPGPELSIEMVYRRPFFDEAEIHALLEELRALLAGFAADPAEPGELPSSLDVHRLDRIVRMVHHRAAPSAAGPEAPARKQPGGREIVPVPRDQPLPATFYQEWGLQLEGIEHNCIPVALRIEGPLEILALRRSLTEIVCRHESLRSSFRQEAGEAFLVIAPPAEVPLPIVDLAALPPHTRTELQRRLTAGHKTRAFDMARGPLFVAQLLRLGPREHALLLNTHHLVSDGWSIEVLQRELMVLYLAFTQGRPSPLPPLPIQLADFAWWQRRVFAGEALAAQLAWWRSTLANLPPPPELPIDRPRPETVGPDAIGLTAVLAPGSTQSLRALAQATRSSMPMVLLAAVDALLYVFSGQEDLIVSLIFAARNRPELSEQIGLFMNTVPLRVDLAGNPTFREAVERVRDATIGAYSHQDVPFPRLLAELFPGRKLTRTILSGVCFNMLSFTDAAAMPVDAPAVPAGLTVQLLGGEGGETKHDLVFESTEAGDSLYFNLTGAAGLFTPERMRTIARDFESLLAHVAADPGVALEELRQAVRDPHPRPLSRKR